jgi:hypothetical protein
MRTVTVEEAQATLRELMSLYEAEAGMDYADFFARYGRAASDDDTRSVEWANDDPHFLALHEPGKRGSVIC